MTEEEILDKFRKIRVATGRDFESNFKAKVGLEAIRFDKIINEIAQLH